MKPPATSSALAALVLAGAALALFSFAADKPANEANAVPSQGLQLMQSFLKQEALRLDGSFLNGISSRADWEARLPGLRQQYLESLGLWPLPERTPLHAQVTGTIEREEGFRVEKLHFQSKPRLYVTGNLYLPKDAAPGAKLPTVLYLCGHSYCGRNGNKTAYQHHGMWFATHGYACLVIDTLQLGEIAAIHHGTYRENRWWWHALGYTPAAVECWNGIRALDYLQSRPEVDPERMAVTGRSGGGAATFWITAADDRVKVAVPVSGMSDLEDYVGAKVVNGHCDCMFMTNTFQWPWTNIAALIAPRPMLFSNCGHDTIFPMTGNDRIRARLEKVYGLYTDKPATLFDIAVSPGGHEDTQEIRFMAFRWINHHLKRDDSPIVEPALPKIEPEQLRAFPDALPADELNSKIDETFVAASSAELPRTKSEFQPWREQKVKDLRHLTFQSVPQTFAIKDRLTFDRGSAASGTLLTETNLPIPWKFFPARESNPGQAIWLVVLNEEDTLEPKPDWLGKCIGDEAAFLVAPRGCGPLRFADPAPYAVHRSLPLLGRTADTCQLIDVMAAVAHLLDRKQESINIAGRDEAGVIAAYAAILTPQIGEVMAYDPPSSHRQRPIFLNVLRVLDVPEAFGLLAPRKLTIFTPQTSAFESTAAVFKAAGGAASLRPLP